MSVSPLVEHLVKQRIKLQHSHNMCVLILTVNMIWFEYIPMWLLQAEEWQESGLYSVFRSSDNLF